MKTPVLLSLAVAGGLLATANPGRASVPSFAKLGDNTYACTRAASTTFDRNADRLTREAEEDAAKFCAQHGKEPKLISVTVDKPWFTLGFAKATVVFRALERGDPELADKSPVPVMHAGKKAKETVTAPPPEYPVDELYRSLMKLDELRRRGLLTEEEFQAEKKKVLERSK